MLIGMPSQDIAKPKALGLKKTLEKQEEKFRWRKGMQ